MLVSVKNVVFIKDNKIYSCNKKINQKEIRNQIVMKVLKNTIFTIKNEGRAGLILKAGSHL